MYLRQQRVFSKIEIITDSSTKSYKLFDHVRWTNQIPHDNPSHVLSIGEHCEAAHGFMVRKSDDITLSYAAYFHDCAKDFCKTFVNCTGEVTDIAHYYGHEKVSAYNFIAYNVLSNQEELIRAAILIENHMIFFQDESAQLKFRKLYGEKMWEDLCLLHEADMEAH